MFREVISELPYRRCSCFVLFVSCFNSQLQFPSSVALRPVHNTTWATTKHRSTESTHARRHAPTLPLRLSTVPCLFFHSCIGRKQLLVSQELTISLKRLASPYTVNPLYIRMPMLYTWLHSSSALQLCPCNNISHVYIIKIYNCL